MHEMIGEGFGHSEVVLVDIKLRLVGKNLRAILFTALVISAVSN